MKQGWEYKRLGNVCDLRRGLTYSKDDEAAISSNLVLRSNNIDLDSMKLDLTEIKYLKDSFIIPSEKKLKGGSVFLCMSNGSKHHVGKVAYIEKDMDFAFGGFMGLIVPLDRLFPKFVYYVCRSSLWRGFMDSIGKGIGITNLRFSELADFSIPVPSIDEQKAICSLLDKLNQVIEAKKEQITELDKLAQSLFYDMFGNPITNENNFPIAKLGDVCENLHGIWKGKKTKLVNVGVIRNANFTKDFKLDYSKIEYIDVDADAFAKRYLQNGDLIVEKSGGTNKQPVGRAILYEGKNGVYSFSNFTMVLRIKHNDIINSKYLYYTLKLLYLMGITRQMQTQTTGLRNLILDRYLSLQISLPPMEEQKRFAEKIEKIEELKVKAKKQIEDIKEMLNYSMDKYFG